MPHILAISIKKGGGGFLWNPEKPETAEASQEMEFRFELGKLPGVCWCWFMSIRLVGPWYLLQDGRTPR